MLSNPTLNTSASPLEVTQEESVLFPKNKFKSLDNLDKSKPRVLFINPPNVPFSSSGILIEPIDLLGLASYSEFLGYSTSIIDMDVKCLLAPDLNSLMPTQDSWPDIITIVYDYHIPLHDVGASREIKDICALAKTKNCKIILGGKAATFLTGEKLSSIGADVYVSFEMEGAIKELFALPVKNWNFSTLSKISGITFSLPTKNSNSINSTPMLQKTVARVEKTDLNSLPISNRNLIELNDYIDVRTLLSSRGCNLKCSFCHVPGFWGFFRSRTPSIVADEIEILVKNHNAKKVLFLDDNAMVQPKRMKDIAQELINRGVAVPMGCLGTVDKYSPESLKVMHQAGFRWIHYGAESGDNQQLIEMGKRIDREKIKTAVLGTKDLGFRVRTSWIMDMPGSSLESLKATEELIEQTQSQEVRLHFLTLRLGSLLQQKMSDIEAPQFIHSNHQNLNISDVESLEIEKSVARIITSLTAKGYVLVKNAEDFKNMALLQLKSPELKIVSLCPLRYGIDWKL